MKRPETQKSNGILILVRSPLDPARITLLKKMLQNPGNSAVFLHPSVGGKPFGEKNVFRLGEKIPDQDGRIFSWQDLYALIRLHQRILTLS
jgi:hypothetical protein|uniref:Uncharacterized protein n=1 Tax=Leptospirillum ferriphilum TaxID=178606 RepID=A0A7C3QRM6_9BACT